MGKKSSPEVTVLLVCGLPGSGKSTLSSNLVRNGWVRISQDELGTQAECTKLLEKSLKHKKSVVIDRCMVTPSERKLWVQRARALYKDSMRIETVFMDVPPHLCKTRVSKRKDHPTLGPEGTDVVDQFARGMKIPEKWEGPYDDCFVMRCEKHVKEILPRYLDPQQVEKSVVPVSKESGWEQQAKKKPGAKEEAKNEPKGYKGEVFMVRHGERTDRTGGVVETPDDCAITSKGRHQARQAGEYIAGMTRTKVKAVYSSPFLRCVETAAEIAGQVGVPHLVIEPGLAELYAERLFNGQPMLTPPTTTFRAIEQRCHISIDASTSPVMQQLPRFPETRREANKRITDTVAKLLQSHINDSIVLVMHSHGLVTATANIPKAHKSISSARPDYCGLTHIDASLTADVVTDVTYRGMVSGTNLSTFLSDLPVQPPPSAGKWGRSWDWLPSNKGKVSQDETKEDEPVGPEEEVEEAEEEEEGEMEYRISEVLDLRLEEAAAMYPRFGKFYNQGDARQKEAFKKSWDAGEDKIRKKVAVMINQGMFDTPKMVDHSRPVEEFRMISLDMQSFKKDQIPGVMKEVQKAQPDVVCLQNVSTEAAPQTEDFLGRYNVSTCTAGKRSALTFCLKNLTPIFHTAVLDEGHTVTFCTVYHEQATVVVFNGVMYSSAHTEKAAAMMEGNLKSLGGGCVAILASDSSLSTMDPPSGYTPCTKGANVVLSEGKYSINAKLIHPMAFGHSGVDLTLVLEKAQDVSKGLPKFPRTQHLYSVGKGSVGRDDLLLSESDAKAYHEGKVVVEEKIDGSNLGIFFDEEMHIVCMNRGKVVTAGSGSQWAKLDTWLDEKRSELFSLLGQRFILYGEWMVARHSIHYTRLPDYFIVFDLYDRRAKRFLGVRPRNEMIKGTTLSLIRPISTGHHPTRDAFVSLLTSQSYYTSATIEGVYLRLDTPDGLWLDKRAKIVNAEFMEGIEEGHWQKRVMEKNTLKY